MTTTLNQPRCLCKWCSPERWAQTRNSEEEDDMTDTDRRRILNRLVNFIVPEGSAEGLTINVAACGGCGSTNCKCDVRNADPDDDDDDDDDEDNDAIDDGDGYPAGSDVDSDQDAAPAPPAISHAARRASRSATKTSRETGHGRATSRGIKALKAISSGDHATAVDHHLESAEAHEQESIAAMLSGDDNESDRHHRAAQRHRAASDMIRDSLTTNEVLTMNRKHSDDIYAMTAAQQEHRGAMLHSALTGNAAADGSFADVGPSGAITSGDGDQRGLAFERPPRRPMSPMELFDEAQTPEGFDGRSLTGDEDTSAGSYDWDEATGRGGNDGTLSIPGGRALSSQEMLRKAGLGDLADSRHDGADDDEFGEDEDRDDSVHSDARARSTDVGSRSFTGNAAEEADDVACMTAGLNSHEEIVSNARREALLRKRQFEKRKAVRNRGHVANRNRHVDLGHAALDAWHNAE